MKRKISFSILFLVLIMTLSMVAFADAGDSHDIRIRVEGKDWNYGNFSI